MSIVNVGPAPVEGTMFDLMNEIVRLSFLDEKIARMTFSLGEVLIKDIVHSVTLNNEINTVDYRAKIIDGDQYGCEFNAMIIRIPGYDNALFNAISYKSVWISGKKTLIFCIPEDLSDAPLEELMLLYFKHFAIIGRVANPNVASKTEQSITIGVIYTLLLKMIEQGIGITQCGADTIAKVIPPSIITNNGFDTLPLGEEKSKLIFKHIKDMKLSEDFMEAVVQKFVTYYDINEMIKGKIYEAYAFQLLEQAELMEKEASKDAE